MQKHKSDEDATVLDNYLQNLKFSNSATSGQIWQQFLGNPE